MNLWIRPATQEDLPGLEWAGEYRHFRRLYADVFRSMQRGDGWIWLAESCEAGLVGQLFVSFRSARPELADGKTRAYVYSFRVKTAFRRQGIGSLLMKATEADLMQRGFQWVTLNVSQTNPMARRLYERLGYRVVGADPGRWSYTDDQGQRHDVCEPAWRMEKKLLPARQETGLEKQPLSLKS